MLVDKAVTQIKRTFGDEYGVVINDSDIYDWIYSAELDIIRNSGYNDFSTTAAVNVFPSVVPNNVTIKRVSIAGKTLVYTSLIELDNVGNSTDAKGGPQYWYNEDDKVYLYPVGETSDARTVSILYNKTPTLMSGLPSANTFSVPDVYHDDIVTYCLAKAHNKNNNFQAQQAQMDNYQRNLGLRNHEANSVDLDIYKGADPMDFN